MSDPAPVSRSAQRHLDLIHHREETLARIQNDPAVAEWLNQFEDSQREYFLERYAEERAGALVDGRSFWQQAQDEEAALVQEAGERLWEIQQRKLFELQCRWRAEEVTLPPDQVEMSHDFEDWGSRIAECPLLPPIMAAEVEQYLTYLLSDACPDAGGDLNRPDEWQNYERFRRYLLLQAEGQDPSQVVRDAVRQPEPGVGGLMAMLDDFFLDYPGWYAHCDALAGPPNLVLYLPDHRGAKEAYYGYIGQTGKLPDPDAEDEEDDENAVPAADPPATPAAIAGDAAPLRYLHYAQFGALTDTLMRQFEPAELLRYHEALVLEPAIDPVRPPDVEEDDSEDEDDGEDDRLQERLDEMGRDAGDLLCALPERLPIGAHSDWRVALHYTWLNWRKQRLATALRAAFAAYEDRRHRGAAQPSPYEPNPKMDALLRENRQRRREHVLKGRGLAGEPQDFDF